jgi:hypothetical protein
VLLPASAVVFVITGILSAVLVAAASGLAVVALLLSLVATTPGVFAALGRSRELVRGNGWQVFGVIFVLFFLVLFVSSGVEIAADSAGTAAALVARVIVGVLTGPFSALAAAVLYFELRGAGQATAAGEGLGSGRRRGSQRLRRAGQARRGPAAARRRGRHAARAERAATLAWPAVAARLSGRACAVRVLRRGRDDRRIEAAEAGSAGRRARARRRARVARAG